MAANVPQRIRQNVLFSVTRNCSEARASALSELWWNISQPAAEGGKRNEEEGVQNEERIKV